MFERAQRNRVDGDGRHTDANYPDGLPKPEDGESPGFVFRAVESRVVALPQDAGEEVG